MPTPAVSTSTRCAPRVYLVTRESRSDSKRSPATNGSISTVVAATTRMRIQVEILFLVAAIGEPAKQRAEVHDRRAELDRRHLIDHLAMRRRPGGPGAAHEVVSLGEELDARGGAVAVARVADVQPGVRLDASGLSNLARRT